MAESSGTVGCDRYHKNAVERRREATLLEKFDHSQDETCGRGGLGDPEAEQPFREPSLELRHSLFELGIEPSEVELIQLSKIRPIRRIHQVEPPHELVGDIVPALMLRSAYGTTSRSFARALRAKSRSFALRAQDSTRSKSARLPCAVRCARR